MPVSEIPTVPGTAPSTFRRAVWTAAQLRTLIRSTSFVRTDDPYGFWLLVAQQAPARLVRAVAPLAARALVPIESLAAWRALALWVVGSEDDAVRLASEATTDQARVRSAQLFAAVRRYDDADAMLAGIPEGARAAAAVRARLAWRRGDLVAGIDAATRAELPRRLRRRWEGDLTLLTPGWLPTSRATTVSTRATGAPRQRVTPRATGRVLHLLTNSVPVTRSGYTSRSHEILRAQRDAGLDPLAVTRSGFPAVAGQLVTTPVSVVDGIEYRRITPWTLPRSTDLQAVREVELLAREVDRIAPSVLHTTTHYVNALSALALRELTGLPVVYEVRGFLEETWLSVHGAQGASSDRFRMWRDRETECMLAADVVVTLGDAMKSEIVARGVPEDTVHLAPNAVPDDVFTVLPGRKTVRRELGVTDDDLLVGSVTSVVPYEGLGTAVDAVAHLVARGVPAVLLVVGDGTARAALEQRAAAAGIRAVFTGRVPAPRARAYREALDAFVVPRRDESVTRLVTPLKPVEAMAAGVPVVASDLPPLREIVTAGTTGLLVPPEDPGALADALERLAADRDLGHRLGAAGKDWAREHRTWASVAQTYVNAYSSLGA